MTEQFNEGVLKQRGMERAVVGADQKVLYLGYHNAKAVDPQGLVPWSLAEARELRDWLDTVIPKAQVHATWFDGGYLGNGHCSFMWARNGAGACCNLPHGHEGPHRDDSQSEAVIPKGSTGDGEAKA